MSQIRNQVYRVRPELETIVNGIHHVQITIPRGEEEQARAFYCQLLGLREVEKPESLKARGGFWLQVGDRQVHIGTDPESLDRRATKAHVAYEVSDLASWRNVLTSHGIEILDGVPIPGCERIEFRDPFGNRVEFVEPTGGIPQGEAPSGR